MTIEKNLCYNLFVAKEKGLFEAIFKAHGGIPKLVEGTGLENQQVVQAALGFESLFLRHLIFIYRGVEQFGSSSGS